MKRSISILWMVVIILLLINLTLLYGVNLIRLATLDTLNQTNQMLAQLAQETVVYDVALDQAIPVQASVPFQREMDIPVDTIIPIDQTFTLPLQTPAGEITVTLPLQASFPVDVVVPLSLDEQLDLDTNIHLKTTIPVNIEIGKTPLAAYLNQSRAQLLNLQNLLSFGSDQPDIPVQTLLVQSQPQSEAVQPATDKPKQTDEVSQPPPTSDGVTVTPVSTVPISNEAIPSSSNQLPQPNLGFCLHDYWPLRPNTTWAFVSNDTAFDQSISWVRNNQAQLTSSYENKDLTFDVICYQEGLGGNYVGDMRRLQELGDFTFSNPRGIFLPLSDKLEQENYQWQQELDVAGTIFAVWQDQSIRGRIQEGRFIATYQTQAQQVMPTPLGLKNAIPIQQQLLFELTVSFQIDQAVVTTQQTLTLASQFFFVKGVGPTQAHWQGGAWQLQVEAESLDLIKTEIPSLSPDHLAAVCFADSDGQTTCRHTPDLPIDTVAQAAPSELVVIAPSIPASLMVTADAQQTQDLSTEASLDNTQSATNDTNATASNMTTTNSDNHVADDALPKYVVTINLLSEDVIAVMSEFQDSAFAYAEDKITRAQFKDDFQDSVSDTENLISQFNNISPPPQASAIHDDFNGALDKCTEAKDLLENWFNTGDSSERDRGIRLYSECIDILVNARDDANALLKVGQ